MNAFLVSLCVLVCSAHAQQFYYPSQGFIYDPASFQSASAQGAAPSQEAAPSFGAGFGAPSAFSLDAGATSSLGAVQFAGSPAAFQGFSGSQAGGLSQSSQSQGHGGQQSGGKQGGQGGSGGGHGGGAKKAKDPTYSSEAAWMASYDVTKAYAIRQGRTTLPTTYMIPLDSDLDNFVAVPVPEGRGKMLYYFEANYGPSNCSTKNTFCTQTANGIIGPPCYSSSVDFPDYAKKKQCTALFEDKEASCKVKVAGTYDPENERAAFKAVIDFCKGQKDKKA